MKQNFYLLCLLTLLCFNGCQHTLQKRPLSIDTLAFQYRTEDSFKGIIESFTRKEFTSGRLFLRTNPDVRDGIYFAVSFNCPCNRIPVGSVIKIAYITNLDPKEQVAEWTIPAIKHSLIFQNELYLGVTGDKAYSSQTKLIAWKVDVVHPDGRIIATKHSFAW